MSKKLDPLTIALIRSLNRAIVNPTDPDEELLERFGAGAQILADGIRETIREEVQRALAAV